MSLREIFVFADKDDCGIPKILCFMLLQSITDNFGLANISQRITRFRIGTKEKINPGAFSLFSSKQIIKLYPRGSECFPGPVRHLSNAQSFGIAMWQKQFNGSGCHKISIHHK